MLGAVAETNKKKLDDYVIRFKKKMFPATKTVEMLRYDPLQQQEDIDNKNVNKNNINKSKNDISQNNKNNHKHKNSISINQNDNNINNNNINNIMQQQSVKTTTIT